MNVPFRPLQPSGGGHRPDKNKSVSDSKQAEGVLGPQKEGDKSHKVKVSGKKGPVVSGKESKEKFKPKKLELRRVRSRGSLKRFIKRLKAWFTRDVHKTFSFKKRRKELNQDIIKTLRKTSGDHIPKKDPVTGKSLPISATVWKDMGRGTNYHWIDKDGNSRSFLSQEGTYVHVDAKDTLIKAVKFSKESDLDEHSVPLGKLVETVVQETFENEDQLKLFREAEKAAQQEIFGSIMGELAQKGQIRIPGMEAPDYESVIDYSFYFEKGELKLRAEKNTRHFDILANPSSGEMLEVKPETSEMVYDIILSFRLDEKGNVEVGVEDVNVSLSYDLVV